MTQNYFKAITNFINDLGEFFSKDSHPLALYERLLNKTKLEHVEAVEKHISAFRKFCVDNQESILSKTPTFSCDIVYSAKVFVDMNCIFKLEMDDETRDAIWNHLLTLSALLDSHSNAKEVLKNKNSIVKFEEGEGAEEDFLNNIITKVEKHVNTDTTNPQEAISSIMSSGMITDLVSSLNSGISSGKLDLAKMMGSVQKMVGNISGEAGNDPATANAMSMLNNMMGMMGSK